MKLKLLIELDPETTARDLQAFVASVRYILRGFFPRAKLQATLEHQKRPCKSVTPPSVSSPLN